MNDHVLKLVRKLLERALDDDGAESENALAALKRWMKRNRHDAAWVIEHINDKPAPAPIVLDDWRAWRDYLNEPTSQALLNDHELEFVMDCAEKGERWNATTKRVGWLRSMYTRLQIVRGLNPV